MGIYQSERASHNPIKVSQSYGLLLPCSLPLVLVPGSVSVPFYCTAPATKVNCYHLAPRRSHHLVEVLTLVPNKPFSSSIFNLPTSVHILLITKDLSFHLLLLWRETFLQPGGSQHHLQVWAATYHQIICHLRSYHGHPWQSIYNLVQCIWYPLHLLIYWCSGLTPVMLSSVVSRNSSWVCHQVPVEHCEFM